MCLSMAGHSGSPRSPRAGAGGPTAGTLVAGAGNGDMGRRGYGWVGGDGRGGYGEEMGEEMEEGAVGRKWERACGEEQRSFRGRAGGAGALAVCSHHHHPCVFPLPGPPAWCFI